MKTLIVVGGPTASGKTRLAIELARHYGTEIVSADSRQFYREMRVGNARPIAEELAAAPHHFIADRSIGEALSAGRYAAEATDRLATIFAERDTAILVGGSGLYLKAVCEGLDEFPEITHEANAKVTALHNQDGLEGLQRELERLDPDYYAVVDRSNGRRLERALRVCYAAGQPYSSYLGQQPPRPFRSLLLYRNPEREVLYGRIDRRVDEMIAGGLQEEARALYNYRQLPVLQTVGYQEWWAYFAGEYDRERAIELIKRNSRRYAKRQLTWFRRGGRYHPVTDLAEAIDRVAAAGS